MQRFYFAFATAIVVTLLTVTAGCGGSASPFVAPATITPSIPNIALGTGTPSPGATPCPSSGCTTTFFVTEPGYNGSFHASSSKPNVATVTAGSVTHAIMMTRVAQDTHATFIVTAVSVGNATITVTDDNGNSNTLPVTVGAGLAVTPQLHS